jgi:threonine dehydrogenase-like Zn-dependent dehydrogenase
VIASGSTADGDAPDVVGIAVEAVQPGRAAVGRVDDATERSAALLGRRVLIGPSDPCGQCEVCRRGGAAVCPLARPRGEVGARLRAAARWLVAFGDGIELPLPAAAAVAGDVALAYTIYARTGLGAREPAVITGTNPIARFLVEILLAKAITPTVVADPADEAWCDWLVTKGAAVARGAARDSDDVVRAAVGGAIAAQGVGARPWRVLATDHHAVARACALAGPRATLTLLAPSPPLAAELVAREVTIIGVAGPHPDLVVEAAAMCVKGEIDLAGGVIAGGSDPTRTTVIAL